MYFCTLNVNSRVMICTHYVSSAQLAAGFKASALRRFKLICEKIEINAPIRYCNYHYYVKDFGRFRTYGTRALLKPSLCIDNYTNSRGDDGLAQWLER